MIALIDYASYIQWPSMMLCGYAADADYPGLRNTDAIEDLRKQILNAFRAYTTGLSSCYIFFN